MGNEDSEIPQRYHEGQVNSHKANDSKDERTIANKLAREEQARNHGNEPSKGAKIDAEIQAEEDELLRKKGIKK
ncbi:hypothetical protein MMC29_001051 [Sticta canariensis]|nr:hypothetical protein [Sticta canariensis]